MNQKHGDFIWYELMTSDVEASKSFYGPLLGWTFEQHGGSGMDYHVFMAKTKGIGGFMPISKEMADGGARPLWAGYITVDDVDKAASAVAAEGGQILMPPTDIPTVGRIAFASDPQGAPFYVMKPQPPEGASGPSEAFAAYQPTEGHCAWNELATADPDAAKHWYGRLFGFVQMDSMDMGPMGEYRIMANAGQDFAYGALMKKPDEMPVSLWVYYFRVPDIDKAVSYIAEKGGHVINGPMEIPGGDFVLNGIDPQGAMFALIGKRN
ncbi:MAG: VOC family protein [Novosphingobium sp.]|nr:VOC family protein [Novosphingobium sp.]